MNRVSCVTALSRECDVRSSSFPSSSSSSLSSFSFEIRKNYPRSIQLFDSVALATGRSRTEINYQWKKRETRHRNSARAEKTICPPADLATVWWSLADDREGKLISDAGRRSQWDANGFEFREHLLQLIVNLTRSFDRFFSAAVNQFEWNLKITSKAT